MKKRVLIVMILMLVVTIIGLIVLRNRTTNKDYNEFSNGSQVHGDVIETVEDVNVSLVDIESIPEDIIEICKEQCKEYCLKNNIVNETFMYYDSNESEYIFKSTTTDVYITVNIGGK